MKETLYRVYDHKGNYSQCYSPTLNGLDYAISCAVRVNGKVDKVVIKDLNEEVETVFAVKEKKTSK